MRRAILLLLIFVLLLIIPAAFRYVSYYDLGGSEERGKIPIYDPATVVVAEATPPSAAFTDEPTVGDGRVLLDMAHDNAFTLDEVGYLNGRLSARGYDVIPFDGGNLAAALRAANAFVVITPLDNFTFEEIQAVKTFVNRGGRVLLLGDPTRFEVLIEEDLFEITYSIEDDKIPLNSLAAEFDITFNGDYLYNLTANEGNFRNIILSGPGLAAENALTEDLEQVVFYGAHSLDVGPSATAVLSGDDNTWSSATDRPGGLTLAAASADGRVLALSDIHFMGEPYYTSYDNGRFIAHIADFLTQSSDRSYTLSDFPYFYSQPVSLVYSGQPELGAQAFSQVIGLQEAFREVGQEIELTAVTNPDQDALILGLYNQADEAVLELLSSNGITFTIEPPILTKEEQAALAEKETADTETVSEEDSDAEETETEESEEPEEPEEIRLIHTPFGTVQMSGTSLVLLDESSGQRQVIVLAASKDGLDNTVGLLQAIVPLNTDYQTAGCMLQENLALCPTGIDDEAVEAELITSGQVATDEDEDQPDEDEDEDEQDDDGEPAPDIEAINQGTIGLDETVEGELSGEESHAWTFNSGPGFIDIVAEGNDEMDLVLELYDADNNLVTSADSTFTGETEELTAVDIEDDRDYTIIVRDFYDDGGAYTLTVSLSDDQSGASEGGSSTTTIENIFLFVDDDGEPVGDGFTSADALLALLSDSYEVTTWLSSVDGPLEEDTLDGTDLIIWDSGDYRNTEGFLDEDTGIIFQYLDDGGMLFVTGSSPTILADVELAPLADVEITGDDPILLDGLESGDVLVLDEVYETAVSDVLSEDAEEGSTVFFLRGPESDNGGDVVGIAAIDQFTEQRSVVLLLPFTILPEEIQETLLNNIMAWFTADIGE